MNLKDSRERIEKIQQALPRLPPDLQGDVGKILQELQHYHEGLLQMEDQHRSLAAGFKHGKESEGESFVPHPHELGRYDAMTRILHMMIYKN